nr:hypothetical protein [Tanacetum cinerariifolium]
MVIVSPKKRNLNAQAKKRKEMAPYGIGSRGLCRSSIVSQGQVQVMSRTEHEIVVAYPPSMNMEKQAIQLPPVGYPTNVVPKNQVPAKTQSKVWRPAFKQRPS